MGKKSVTVTIERFREKCDNNTMLLHFSGRIAEYLEDAFQDKLLEIGGVEDVQVVTSKMVCIAKDEGVSWRGITSAVQKITREFLGEVSIVKRTRRAVPWVLARELAEINMDSIREDFLDCSLTEEERDALGLFLSDPDSSSI